MSQSDVHPVDLPKVAGEFSIQAHLANAEKRAEGIRFLCKVIGETGDKKVLCETDDGVYEFARADVLGLKSVNSKRDLLVVRREAPFTLHSTLARISRVDGERLRVKDMGAVAGARLPDMEAREVFDTVMFPGSHEWRGITD